MLFFREPIVPVIKKFWYRPDSGTITGKPEIWEFPMYKQRSEEFMQFIWFTGFSLVFEGDFLNRIKIFNMSFLNKKLEITKLENIKNMG